MDLSGQLHALVALPPGKSDIGTHWIGGWVGPTVGLNSVANRNISCPCRKSNTDLAAHGLSTMLSELPRLPLISSDSELILK